MRFNGAQRPVCCVYEVTSEEVRPGRIQTRQEGVNEEDHAQILLQVGADGIGRADQAHCDFESGPNGRADKTEVEFTKFAISFTAKLFPHRRSLRQHIRPGTFLPGWMVNNGRQGFPFPCRPPYWGTLGHVAQFINGL